MNGRPSQRVISGVLAAFAALLYARSMGFGFVNYDDPLYVTENPWVTGGFTPEAVQWAFTIHGPSMWVPLTWLSHQAVCTLVGLDPALHHAVNVALHALNAALVFLAFHRLTGAVWRPALAAMLFAVHPLHVESVAWVTERKDVLALAGVLLTLLAYERYARARSLKNYALVTGAFLLAIMAKPLAVTVPALLLVLDFWPLQRVGERVTWRAAWPLLREKLPLLAISAFASWLTLLCQFSIHAVGSLEAFPLSRRIANAVLGYGTYLGHLAWPVDLAVFYPYPHELPWGAVAVSALVLAALTALAVRFARTAPWVLVGWCWFLGTFVPMIGLVQAGSAGLADRYAYFPALGLYVALAWSAGALAERFPFRRSWIVGTLAVLAVGWAGLTWRQVGFWRDSETLFRHALVVTGPNHLASNNLGIAARASGRQAEAEEHFRAALAADPNYYEAVNNLGIQRAEAGDYLAAHPLFERAIALKPYEPRAWVNLGRAWLTSGQPARAANCFREALARDPGLMIAHFHLGLAHQALGQLRDAAEEFRRTLLLNPAFLDAWRAQAAVMAGLGGVAESAEAWRRAAALAPRDPDLQITAGLAALKAGDSAAAERLFNAALAARPNYAPALQQIGRLWQSRHRPTEAAQAFLAAVNAAPANASLHHDLGLLYGELGDHATAARAFREAVRLQPDWEAARQNLARAEAALAARPAPAAAPTK